jgi:hypothetical protein
LFAREDGIVAKDGVFDTGRREQREDAGEQLRFAVHLNICRTGLESTTT